MYDKKTLYLFSPQESKQIFKNPSIRRQNKKETSARKREWGWGWCGALQWREYKLRVLSIKAIIIPNLLTYFGIF